MSAVRGVALAVLAVVAAVGLGRSMAAAQDEDPAPNAKGIAEAFAAAQALDQQGDPREAHAAYEALAREAPGTRLGGRAATRARALAERADGDWAGLAVLAAWQRTGGTEETPASLADKAQAIAAWPLRQPRRDAWRYLVDAAGRAGHADLVARFAERAMAEAENDDARRAMAEAAAETLAAHGDGRGARALLERGGAEDSYTAETQARARRLQGLETAGYATAAVAWAALLVVAFAARRSAPAAAPAVAPTPADDVPGATPRSPSPSHALGIAAVLVVAGPVAIAWAFDDHTLDTMVRWALGTLAFLGTVGIAAPKLPPKWRKGVAVLAATGIVAFGVATAAAPGQVFGLL